MLKGELVVTYVDGKSDTCQESDLFYWPPGHQVRVVKDSEVIDQSSAGTHGSAGSHAERHEQRGSVGGVGPPQSEPQARLDEAPGGDFVSIGLHRDAREEDGAERGDPEEERRTPRAFRAKPSERSRRPWSRRFRRAAAGRRPSPKKGGAGEQLTVDIQHRNRPGQPRADPEPGGAHLDASIRLELGTSQGDEGVVRRARAARRRWTGAPRSRPGAAARAARKAGVFLRRRASAGLRRARADLQFDRLPRARRNRGASPQAVQDFDRRDRERQKDRRSTSAPNCRAGVQSRCGSDEAAIGGRVGALRVEANPGPFVVLFGPGALGESQGESALRDHSTV